VVVDNFQSSSVSQLLQMVVEPVGYNNVSLLGSYTLLNGRSYRIFLYSNIFVNITPKRDYIVGKVSPATKTNGNYWSRGVVAAN
jgi:hypothetical protein